MREGERQLLDTTMRCGPEVRTCSLSLATFPNLSSNDKPRQENRGSSHRIFAQSLRIESLRPPSRSIMDKIDSSMIRLVVEPPLIEDVCSYELHPLPKNVFSSRLVSTFAITTHPPRCCEDHARLTKANARLVADKLANGKEPKEARRPAPHNRYRDGAPHSERSRHGGSNLLACFMLLNTPAPVSQAKFSFRHPRSVCPVRG